MVEINIDSALKVNTSNIVGGTAERIFYEKLDNTLGQVPGFGYSEAQSYLFYYDTTSGLGMGIGQIEVAPSILIPGIVFANSFGASFSVTDATSLGGDVTSFLGFEPGDSFRVVNGNESSIRSNYFRILSQDNSNVLLETTNTEIAFYGVTPTTRQIISANPTNAEIATVLNNIGIAEIV